MKITTLILALLVLALGTGTAMVLSLQTQPVVACDSPKLLNRPGRIVVGAAVFALGILGGAGIAAWLMPPV